MTEHTSDKFTVRTGGEYLTRAGFRVRILSEMVSFPEGKQFIASNGVSYASDGHPWRSDDELLVLTGALTPIELKLEIGRIYKDGDNNCYRVIRSLEEGEAPYGLGYRFVVEQIPPLPISPISGIINTRKSMQEARTENGRTPTVADSVWQRSWFTEEVELPVQRLVIGENEVPAILRIENSDGQIILEFLSVTKSARSFSR